MDGADEDHAEEDPKHARQPAEGDAREDGADDGPGGGDCAEVLGEQEERARGHEVVPIVVLVGGRAGVGTQVVLARDEAPINEVACGEGDEHENCEAASVMRRS